MQKNLPLQAASLGVNPLKVEFSCDANLNGYFLQLRQHVDVLGFEGSKLTDRKKLNWPCIKPVSWQNKLESGLFSTLFAYANEATVTG